MKVDILNTTGCNGDGPTYMYVRHAFLTNRYNNSADIELCLQ